MPTYSLNRALIEPGRTCLGAGKRLDKSGLREQLLRSTETVSIRESIRQHIEVLGLQLLRSTETVSYRARFFLSFFFFSGY